MSKDNILLWLEDRPETIATEAVYAKNAGLIIKIAPTLIQFMDMLEEYTSSNTYQIKGMVIDIFVYRARDLSVLNGEYTSNQGYDAGWLLLQHKLSESIYNRIPILLYSVKELEHERRDVIDRLNQDRPSKITYLEKMSISEKFIDWCKTISD